MPTLNAKRRSSGRSPSDRSAPATAHGQDGFLLIEVIISALLVAMIVIATLSGFDVVTRASVDQRQRNQAIGLAAQSQDQLRSDPASTLELLEATPRTFTQQVAGTTYTIKQTASLEPQSGSSGSCSATETGRQSGNAFSITSTVSWPQQAKSKRGPVVASSTITPPTGSALEIDAYTGPGHEAGVSGITAYVTYTPVGSSTPVTLQQTTGSSGCVVFAAIPATKATVEIKSLAGFVTTSGAATFPTKEVTLAPNYTTHYPVVYYLGGAIQAEFLYEGHKELSHLNNEETAQFSEAVTSDTFVAANTEMQSKPNFEDGSTRYGSGTSLYEPLTGTFEATATTKSNIFPFTAAEKHYWRVYGGDCSENDAELLGGATLTKEVVVEPGRTSTVAVPLSRIRLNLYKKSQREVSLLSKKWEALETTQSYTATITNSTCEGLTPNNEIAVTGKHAQLTTTGTTDGGHLSVPFQPFGKEIEVSVSVNGHTYTREQFNLTSVAGEEVNIYLGQPSPARKAELTKEEETKQKEAETAWLTKQKETVRVPRENEEAAKRALWKKEYEVEHKINKFTYEGKINTQTSERKTAEAKEASEASTQKTKELKEESEKRAAREKEEKEEATATKVTVT